ncbi:Auxin-responsive protein IAA6 [Striga hermonthica]|uniref:Auxin-responsive protein n=1 Tax=Striga hermonthica TaxID=68872 RepID=A0A9N7NNJ6_STRHE|nr:Auxin-responsive protein IAA6 [Striga hermonthica]
MPVKMGLETELRLGLPGGGGGEVERNEMRRVFSDISSAGGSGGEEEGKVEAVGSKNQVVGWPPVAAYRRKNNFGWAKMYVKEIVVLGLHMASSMERSDSKVSL